MATALEVSGPPEPRPGAGVPRTEDRRVQEIFLHFDRDQDGFLNYDELNAFQKATCAGDGMTKKQWKSVCNQFGLSPKSGLTLEHVLITYATGSADLEADYATLFPGKPQPMTPTLSLRLRSASFVSRPVTVASGPGQAVDLAALDAAGLVMSCAGETHFQVAAAGSDEAATAAAHERFNKRWRTALKLHAALAGAQADLDEWLATGLSNGRPLYLQVMALKAHEAWKVHAHPNFEFEWTLAGVLKEVRLTDHHFPAADFQGGGAGGATVNGSAVAGDSAGEAAVGFEGPDLAGAEAAILATAAAAAKAAGIKGGVVTGSGFAFEEREVPAGKFLANRVGSVHQSYTGDEGALVLVLWSGCHANVRPEHCAGLRGHGASLLKPGAGWAT